ncbi:MAG TPA: transglutaminase-like cysteine peptidase [Rhodospirillales bacterium]|nr:transglutaminase-like cysteine peptidase [Rhodospirillales bacterium]
MPTEAPPPPCRLGRPARRSLLPAMLLAAALIVAGGPLRAAAGVERPSFFDSVEVRSEDLAAFRKWRGALDRAGLEARDPAAAGCTPAGAPACAYGTWLQFLDGQRGVSRFRQLQAVNDEINRRRWVADDANWGTEDYWESPGEFLARDGDCEDFAIAKYFSLRRLGWPDSSLRIVAVRDQQLGIGHAVLIAILDGVPYLLDNQIRALTRADRVHHYRPVYSINESAWWQHRSRDGRPAGAVARSGALAATGGGGRRLSPGRSAWQ